MSLSAYLKNRLIDCVLCIFMVLGLGLNVVQGFHVADEIAMNPLIVLAATAPFLIALFFVGYNKRSLLVGIPALIVGIVIYCAILAQFTPTPLFHEGYENNVLVFVVLPPVALAVYLLSRTRNGLAALFVIGCLACGIIQFLYATNLIAPTMLFIITCATLYLIKTSASPIAENSEDNSKRPMTSNSSNADTDSIPEPTTSARNPYLQNGLQSALAKGTDTQLPRLIMGFGLAAASCLLGAGLFFLVIAPLNPPAHELKLITEYYSLEEVHVSGLLAFLHQRNDDLSSRNFDEESRYSDSLSENEQDANGDAHANDDGTDEQKGAGSYDALTVGDPLSLVRYLQEHWWIGVLVLVFLVVAWIMVVALVRLRRKRRLQRWSRLDPDQRCKAIFQHVCCVLEKASLIERGSKTPAELAESAHEFTRRLERQASATDLNRQPRKSGMVRADQPLMPSQKQEREAGSGAELPRTDFEHLATCFSRVSYGSDNPTPDEIAQAETYVTLLPKRLLKTIGHLRYLRHFLRV